MKLDFSYVSGKTMHKVFMIMTVKIWVNLSSNTLFSQLARNECLHMSQIVNAFLSCPRGRDAQRSLSCAFLSLPFHGSLLGAGILHLLLAL